ncbi:type-F conjugative transfer system pilin acetylase TraX domain protein, partial [Escherichia coli 3006]
RFWYGDFFPVFYACHLTVLGVLALCDWYDAGADSAY